MKRNRLGAVVVVVLLLTSGFIFAQQPDSASNSSLSDSSTPTVSSAQSVAGTVPRLVRFASILRNFAGELQSGAVTITFSLYEEQEGGTPLWAETQRLNLDEHGRYDALLGATQAEGLPLDLFTSGKARWLGIQPALPGVGELPRVLLVGVPYALKAADADTLGGLPASAFVQTSQGTSGTSNSPSSNAKRSNDASTGSVTSSGAPAAITGSGRASFIPIWLNPTTLSSSTLFQNAAKQVGIGTTTPAATLEVNGTAKFDQAVTFATGQTFSGAASLGPNIFSGTQTIASGDVSVSTGNLDLPGTTGATTGVITLGGTPFLHGCCGSSVNTFVGPGAGNFTTTGVANTASGDASLSSNTSGSSNMASGVQALQSNTTGGNNTASGNIALGANTTGSNNTAVGFGAGIDGGRTFPTTGSNSTFVGAFATAAVDNLTNATAIGFGAQVGESNALVLGGTGSSGVNVGIGTATPAAALEVNGTAKFDQLVTFASGQSFPGAGTITGVTPGSDLTGGGTTGTVTISLDTTKVPQLSAANTFSGNQTIGGNVTLTGSGNGVTFPDGTKQTSASPLTSNAVCSGLGNISTCATTLCSHGVLSEASAPCTITSDTGSCSEPLGNQGECCRCAP